jgi:acetylornithine deacetylase/succinyl-diaminopimelate desuccinylase-like protein
MVACPSAPRRLLPSGRALAQLCEFLRIPSISAQPRHAVDVRRCAIWLAQHLRQIGLPRVEVLKTPCHPAVYAEWLGAPGRPTLLVYGHYDVQPVDPLSAWRSPPFQPLVRDGVIQGRGSSDDKGPLFAHVKAIEFLLRRTGRLPVNVKCLFEGEEEIGSPSLEALLRRHRERFRADAAVISDTRMPGPDQPAVTTSLRGNLALELCVFGPRQDLHSGGFGGAVHNPVQALSEFLAGLHDAHGRITMPGFYDDVRIPGDAPRGYLRRHGPRDQELLEDAGVPAGWGEAGYTLCERATIRPALTINGIQGGYQGPGGKGIIPADATVKLSFRLVPDQHPGVIDRLFRAHAERVLPPTVRHRVRTLSRAYPVQMQVAHPAFRAARRAYQAGFGRSPVFLPSGGTVPVVNMFQEILRLPTVLMGFALPDDQMHAPNEHFRLDQFFKGIATCVHFLRALAALPRREVAP